MTPILAWHFVSSTLRDGRPVPPDGVWLEHAGPVRLGVSGLHACPAPYDALRFAPGPVLCLVHLSGEIFHGGDNIVASRRRIIRRVDMTEYLRYYARMRALSVVHLWGAPGEVLDFLMTGEGAEKAARPCAIAYDAENVAAYDAERAAAYDAKYAAVICAVYAVYAATYGANVAAATNAAVNAAVNATGDGSSFNAAYLEARAEFNALVAEAFGASV